MDSDPGSDCLRRKKKKHSVNSNSLQVLQFEASSVQKNETLHSDMFQLSGTENE